MSKPKRTSFVDLLNPSNITSSRDDVVTLSSEPAIEVVAKPAPKIRAPKAAKVEASATSRSEIPAGRRSLNDKARHSYHTSLYLPEEAQFALREIALTMRRAKPHDVMLEAMAEMFAKYNKGDLAAECRRRITSRDKIVT